MCERSEDIPLDTQAFRKQITPMTFLEKKLPEILLPIKSRIKIKSSEWISFIEGKKKRAKVSTEAKESHLRNYC